MRVYLVVIDESEEALSALRFAARRAADTDGAVHILALVPKQAFSAFVMVVIASIVPAFIVARQDPAKALRSN